MASLVDLFVTVKPDVDGFDDQLKKKLNRIDARKSGDKVGSSFGDGMSKSVGLAVAKAGSVIAAGFAAVKVGGFLKDAINEASDLNEAANALNKSYGKASAGIQDLGKKAATSLGLSNNEFNGLAVKFSSFAKQIAGPGGNVVGTLDELTTRASDFASVMNLEVNDAAEIFQSALAGESEPIRKYGIDVSAAAVGSYAMANGIAASASEMTQAQKTQATYGLIMDATASSAGDFADTSDQLANSNRIMASRFKDITGELGSNLLPVMQLASAALAGPVLDAVSRVVDKVPVLTTGLHAAYDAFREGDVTSDGFVGAMERIGNGVRGVYELVAQGSFTSFFRDAFRVEEDSPIFDTLLSIREGVIDFGLSVVDALRPAGAAFGDLLPTFASLVPQIFAVWTQISPLMLVFQALVPVLPVVAGALASVAAVLAGALVQLLPSVLELAAAIGGALSVALALVVPAIASLVPMLAEGLVGALDAVLPFLVFLVEGIANLVAFLAPVAPLILGVVLAFQAFGAVQAILAALKVSFIATWAAALGPVGLIIAGIALVVAALAYFFTRTETGKAIVEGAMAGIRGAIGFVVDWFTLTAVPAFAAGWEWVKTAFWSVIEWLQTTFSPAIDAVWSVIKVGVELVALAFDVAVFLIKGYFAVLALAATWLWETALAPVFGWIAAGWGAMVDGIVWYWENGIKPAWGMLSDAATWMWVNVLAPVFGWIKDGWALLVAGVVWYWENGIKPAWGMLSDAATWMWTNVLAPTFTAIKDGWGLALDGMKWVWENVLSPVFEALKTGVGLVKAGFDVAVDGIAKAWDKIKAIATAPVKFVLETVLQNGLFKIFDDVAKFFGSPLRAPSVAGPLKALKEFDVGGYTGDGAKHEPKGVVHGGEYVLTKDRTSRIGVGVLEQLEDFLPGYAGGGAVPSSSGGIVALGRWLQGQGARVAEHPAFGGVSPVHRGRGHYEGRAIDVNAGGGGANAIEQQLFDRLAPLIKAAGYFTLWRTKGHYDHLHAETRNGGGGTVGEGGSGIGGAVKSLLSGAFDVMSDPLGYLKDKSKGLLDKMPGGDFGKVIGGALPKILPMAVDKIKSMLPFGGGGVPNEDGGPASRGPAGSGVQRWAPLVLQALARVGQPADLLQTVLRRMNQESGGNPRAINLWDSNAKKGIPSKGLLQTIDPTFQAHRDRSLPNDVYDPFANIVASLRYTMKQYGSVARGYNRVGGYDTGGILGHGQQGINLSGRPERVLSPTQTQSFERLVQLMESGQGPTGGAPVVGNLTLQSSGNVRDDVAEAVFALRRIRRGGVYAGAR